MPRIEIRVPDLGSFKDVAVIELLVKPGETVEVDTPLVTLETEKATMDVPSPSAGVVESVAIAKGALVNAGDLVVVLQSEGVADTAAADAPRPTSPVAAAAMAAAQPPPTGPAAGAAAQPAVSPAAVGSIPGVRGDLAVIDEPGFSRAHAGPSVRRLARELGVDLAKVTGSGVKGRITHDDVKAWVKATLSRGGGGPGAPGAGGAALPRVPSVDFAAFGPVEVKPLSRIQRISGARLHASWLNLPHVTQFDEADITELEAARAGLKEKTARDGLKVTPLAFIIRACAQTLAQFPEFNASLDERAENLVLKRYCHIGFAADTPNGLMVPVIRDADRLDVFEIARALAALSEKARAGKLTANEMQGGSFTVSSLGGIGGTAFTPIINAPEVAILGVARSAMKPVYQGGQFVPRLMLPLALSYDHRVIDGAAGARFITALSQRLTQPQGLLEAVP